MDKKSALQYNNESEWQYIRGKHLLALASPKTGETVIDLGCGTGKLTQKLAHCVSPKGQVIAIDPDPNRLDIVKHYHCNTKLPINFILGSDNTLCDIKTDSIDLIYSNYVIHWIDNKLALLQNAHRCLKEEGRFVMELVGELPTFITNITKLTEDHGQRLLSRFHCLSYVEWEALLQQNHFTIEHMDWIKLDYTFSDLEHFFSWWESTTHGTFQRSMLSEHALLSLATTYPQKVTFSGYSLQSKVRKSQVRKSR
ncbi:class I SAM-dependent methyltransferase [uncultured Shewanella sp.]|uniref:class I SAM-dependent methyltransferase n=1 Tax=uncultured Shewanella sp. TaxID=173975 RepID=UPI0026342433|nr:class I SAM-dependent methyltransferase [uncultured Shewanella sp.]